MRSRQARRSGGACLVALILTSLPVASGVSVSRAADPAETYEVRIGPNVRLGTDPHPARGRDVIGMSVDPSDPKHIVQTDWEYPGQRCEYHVTFDGAKTWTRGFLTAPPGFPDPPCYIDNNHPGGRPSDGSVSFGAGGNVYSTFSVEHDGDRNSIIVVRSTDGGRTFNQSIAAIPYSTDVDYRRPKLTVVRGESPKNDIVYVTSWACGGRTIPTSIGNCSNVVFTSSRDSGRTFTEPTPVNSFTAELALASDNSQIAVASDGSIYVVYKTGGIPSASLRLAASHDQGGTWEQSTVRSSFRSQRGFIDPKLAIDQTTDALYLVYEEATGSSGSDIFLQSSTDAGGAWSAPVRVNDDETATNQIAPWVSVAKNGRIDLTWFDQRNTYPGNSLEDVYYTYSTDGGETFAANRRVTDRVGNRDVGYKPRLGVFAPVNTPIGGNRVLVAWADSRQG
nr:exo-alpha-sialidase [Actinomycetota bacterium]